MAEKKYRKVCRKYGCACRWRPHFTNESAERLMVTEARLDPEWAYRMGILLGYMEDYDR